MRTLPLNSDYWDALFDAISSNRVIPVIGPNAIRFSEEENLNEYILRRICEKNKLPHSSSFDDMLYKRVIKESDLHALYRDYINSLTDEEVNKILEQSVDLRKLLEIKNFTLILSLMPDYMLEKMLKEIWKSRIPEGYKSRLDMKDVIYGPNDEKVTKDMLDLPRGWSKKYPFVVYLFGRFDGSGKLKPFAITEDDTMFFVRKLISPRIIPSRLSNYMKNKYFLFIGCDFTEWMFRFLYSAWRDMYGGKSFDKNVGDMLDSTLTVDKEKNNLVDIEAFDYFVKNINLKIGEKHSQYLSALTDGYEKYKERKAEKFKLPPHIDVFISYASDDFDIANKLCESLKEKGVEAWLDKKEDEANPNRLHEGDHFPNVIKDAIMNSTIFVPVITKNIMQATSDRYVFEEWEQAQTIYDKKIKANPFLGFIQALFIDCSFDSFMETTFKNTKLEEMKSYLQRTHHDKGEKHNIEHFVDNIIKSIQNNG